MYLKKLVGICFFPIFISCVGTVRENPAEMFTGLFEKYKATESESRRIEGGLPEGVGIVIFDVNKEISEDVFCQLKLYSSLGQTQY